MKKNILGVNKSVFLLGIVSFLTDISSEMIFSVFSIFFTLIIGASVALLGVVEGLADFASSSLDYVSGFISDKTGKRKVFASAGYLFSAAAKAILVFSSAISSAAVFRVIERFGKSFRGPPRDAWIASLSDKKTKGYSFGVHKALDKAGAVVGPFCAYLLLNYFGQNIQTFKLLFKVALAPAILAFLLVFLIKEKKAAPAKKESMFRAYKTLGKDFKHYFYTAGIFSIAYFSFGFLLLKAYSVGFQIKDIVLLYALFNIAFVIVSAPIGKIGDRVGRKRIIAAEYVIYLLMCIGFIFAFSKIHVILLFILFGIFYAIDEGQSRAYITDLEKTRKATAIGAYNFATGIIYLPASVIAGLLWKLNSNYAFGFAALASLAAFVFFVARRK